MNIVLGVSGGIAAYKAVALARLFVEAGHEVHVVPTASALRFVGAVTWEAISGHPVTHETHEGAAEVRHVRLGQQADVVVIAPATASTIARMVTGAADDLLGTTLLATRAPVVIAPAMHTEMWEHPATQHNIAVLRERGVTIVGPESGRLTGPDTGPGRMSEPPQIFAATMGRLSGADAGSGDGADAGSGHSADLAGLRVAVSAGGTREPIDPVRFIGNRSSGRQGVALALAAAERGARIDLVAANIDSSVLAEVAGHPRVRVVAVGSTAELEAAMGAAAAEADVVIMSAAVADFRPREIEQTKIRKAELAGEAPAIELVQNPDVLAGLVAQRVAGQVIVGFAAETADDETRLLELGREKMRRKGTDLLVVNRVGWQAGFETETNEVHLLNGAGEVMGRADGAKREVADAVLDAVLALR